MNRKIRYKVFKILALILSIGAAAGIFFVAEPQKAKAEASCHVSCKRYTRSTIKFYYYPTSRALGGGLMYQDDGTPTYCIWWSGSTVLDNTLTSTDLEDVVSSEECLDGLYVIMQNGYDGGTDYTVGGVNLASYGSGAQEKEELAYYATSWAIHLWMARYGYERTTLVQNTANAMTWETSALRAYGTNGKVSNSTMGAGTSDLSKAAWRAAMELLVLAVEGEERSATADISLKSQNIVGNYDEIVLDITTTNATGWTLTYSSLPNGSSVSKTSGTGSSDTVTVKIPISDSSSTYQFTVTPTGSGRYVSDSYKYITGTGELQSLLSWDANITGTGKPDTLQVSTAAAPEASLTLKKVDVSTGEAISGVTFTIQEQVTVNGTSTWLDVGTLADSDGNGTYTDISLTSWYDTSGTAHSYSTAKTALVRTQYNNGCFRVKETAAPAGYTALGTSWYWYVKVQSAGSWSSTSFFSVLGGGLSGSWVVGKVSENGAVWHYIKEGGTADYSNYAAYNTSAASAYDYGTSLGNTAESAKLSLTKVDSITGTAVTGAVFTIYERVNGTWYAVGTLTDDDGNGTYSNISVTCHYSSSGAKKTLDTAQTKLFYTSANGGDYRIKETTPPAGYEAQTGWEWLVRVIPSGSWTGTMYSRYGISSDGTEMVGYRSSGSAFWSYVKGSSAGSNTATYALNAKYNDTMEAYNYGDSKLGNTGVSADVSLSKADNSTGETLSGAVFTVYERTGGTWRTVGTLTDGDGNGTYTDLAVTKHYLSDGTEIPLSSPETKLVYTSANGGEYRIKETSAPEGYNAYTAWEWLVRVIPAADWADTALYRQLDPGNYSAEMIGYPTSSSTGIWTYIKSGNTAYYSHYAPYAKNASLYNYGTKLGNTPKGIDVTLTKVDAVTGDRLTGAVFSVEEKVNGSWYEVGTLTDSDGDGIYTDVSVTVHYSTNGKEQALAQAQTQLVYTEANGGEYRLKETAPPDNYEISEDWCWYVTVVREALWPSGSDTTGLTGTLLATGAAFRDDTWKVLQVSDTKAVMYVVQEGTADYSYYAMYDVNEDNRLVAGANTSYLLGNRGIPAGLTLDKIDYSSEELLSGITFEIQEYVNETWYTVGTLSESGDTAGTYDVIEITKHYYIGSGGSVKSKTLTEAEDELRYTSANGGLYRVVETGVPAGYQLAADWAWYVQVSSESTLKSASGYGDVLGGSDSEGYKVVGLTGTVFAVYSATDNSLTFYNRTTVPTVNSVFEGKSVTELYTGFDTETYGSKEAPWYTWAGQIQSITVADYGIRPVSTQYWFTNFKACTTADLSRLDTSQVTSMRGMFSYCTALASLDISTFDTSGVVSFLNMFLNCTALTKLDLSGFDVSAAADLSRTITAQSQSPFYAMFNGCTGLKTIYTSGNWYEETWALRCSMFSSCELLTGGNGTTFQTDDSALAVIDGRGISELSGKGYFTYRAAGVLAQTPDPSAEGYAMVVHYILTDGTADYSDYAACDTSGGNIAYNYELSDGKWVLANYLKELNLKLTKRGSNGQQLSGAEFTIQEKVGDTWYNIGTLTSGGGNYIYDTVNITCHYDEDGNKIELANAQAGLVLLSSNTGTYRVIETKAPGGYYCPTPDEWSWDLTVDETTLENDCLTTTATNDRLSNYAVSVYKLWDDADDYAGARPASVTVTLLKNGKTYGSSVTLSESNNWSYSWTDLDPGATWTITETSTRGYTATTTYTETSMQRIYTITNTYQTKTTEVTAVKVWDDDDNAAGMRPASVKVALYADGVKQGDSVTLSADTGWSYTWTKLKYYKKGSTSKKITYTVVEEEVSGYVQSKTSVTDSTGNLTVTMTNTITKIPFLKTDAAGNALAGAVLRIVDAKENTVAEWTTDGTAHVVYGLAAGSYILTEASAPDGYLRAAAVSFTVGEDGKLADGSTTLILTDENTSVNFLKTDAETGEALAGAKLSVTRAETGEEVLSWISGDGDTKASSVSVSSAYPNLKVTPQTDGSILAECLPVGEYILNETEAPDGYQVAAEVVFTVTETSTTQSVTIEDERCRELQILKTDAEGNAVIGATLALYQGNLTGTDEDALVELWVTDGTAHVLENIAVGTYTLFELYTPAGYVTAEPVTVTITEESGTVTAVMKDEPITVAVLKTDKTTGAALAGATLKVTDTQGNTVVSFVSGSGSVKASSITVGDSYQNQITTAALSDGSLKITCLPAGDYILTETKTPDGYVTAETVSFTVGEKTETQSVTMEDDHTKVQISKTDLTNGTDVANAELKVTDESGNTVLTWTTGEVISGTASITSVTVGSTYQGKIGTAAVVNADGNWAIEIDYLPTGTYTLTETSVPDGYVKAEAVSFTVEETGEIRKVEMQDDVTKLALYKMEAGTLVSETDGDGNVTRTYTSVAGATLALTDSAGNLIVRFTSGDAVTKAAVSEIGDAYKNLVYTEVTADGGVAVYRLPADTACTLTEESTPAGYITGTSVKFTTTESDDMAYIFMENDYTKLAVWKLDAETGEELPGALLQILDENGDVVAEWYSGSEEFVLDADGKEILIDSEGNVVTGLTQVTNADGTVTVYDANGNVVTDVTRLTEFVAAGAPHEIDRLAAGTYTLHEVSAPENYNVADDICFRIAADGTVTSLTAGTSVTLTDGVYTITMEDQAGVPIYISKADEYGNPLAGAVLALYEGDVTEVLLNGDKETLEAALIERWNTDGTDHLIEHVKKGTYTLVEESAPDGYALTSAMIVTVDGSQNPYYITVVNTPEMNMPSTGGAGMVPMTAFTGMMLGTLGGVLLFEKKFRLTGRKRA
ncbi:MAG: Cna B-type domain-containing protein [Lachnospiraceae bacterium]|nr:Cna B-type domain-containing protein [Lachnospiraceae bacterium]